MDQPIVRFRGNFDPRQAALFFPSISALIGLCVAGFGVWLIVSPKELQSRSALQRFWRDLTTWGVTPRDPDSAEIETLHKWFIQLAGWSLFGAGLCGTVASAALAWLAIGASGALASVAGSADLHGTVLYQSFALGWTLGYLAGSYTVTRVASALAWADLRRRRVSDYRAGWLGWGQFALVGVTLALLMMMYLKLPHIRFTGASESQPWQTLPNVPLLPALALWALLIPSLGALLCRWIATSPRTMTASDPQVARAADERWRAFSIGIVTGYTWVSCGITLTAVANMASLNLTIPLSLPGLALDALSFLGVAASSFGLVLNVLRGRLGGKATGWRLSLDYILGI
jgi:hypothetical protein